MLEKLKKLREIKDLRAEIEECKDDKRAIHLQEKLVNLLRETFEDRDMMAELLMKNNNKE